MEALDYKWQHVYWMLITWKQKTVSWNWYGAIWLPENGVNLLYFPLLTVLIRGDKLRKTLSQQRPFRCRTAKSPTSWCHSEPGGSTGMTNWVSMTINSSGGYRLQRAPVQNKARAFRTLAYLLIPDWFLFIARSLPYSCPSLLQACLGLVLYI